MNSENFSPEKWLAARKALLHREKAFTKLRDQFNAEGIRRNFDGDIIVGRDGLVI